MGSISIQLFAQEKRSLAMSFADSSSSSFHLIRSFSPANALPPSLSPFSTKSISSDAFGKKLLERTPVISPFGALTRKARLSPPKGTNQTICLNRPTAKFRSFVQPKLSQTCANEEMRLLSGFLYLVRIVCPFPKWAGKGKGRLYVLYYVCMYRYSVPLVHTTNVSRRNNTRESKGNRSPTLRRSRFRLSRNISQNLK